MSEMSLLLICLVSISVLASRPSWFFSLLWLCALSSDRCFLCVPVGFALSPPARLGSLVALVSLFIARVCRNSCCVLFALS